MRKFNVRDRVFLDEAIHAFLRESKKFEEESEVCLLYTSPSPRDS